MNSSVVKLSRKELYKEIWTTPARLLAGRFGISDVGLAKTCKRMGIPRPPRGYWRRKETGRKVEVPPLPPPKPTDQLTAEFYPMLHPRSPKPPSRELIPVEVFQSFDQPHPLVALTLERLNNGTEDKKGLLVSTAKQRLALTVSRGQLDRSLRLYDAILKTWEREGNEVLLGREAPVQTVLRSGAETLQISIEEEISTIVTPPAEEQLLTPKWRWKQRSETRCNGTLKILLSGDRLGDWRRFARRFRIGDFVPVEKRASGIVAAALDYLADRKVYLAEEERKRKEREERYRVEEARRRLEEEAQRRREFERKQVEDFFQAAKDWDKARRLREFIAECERRMMESGVAKEEIERWTVWARGKVDELDPLTGGYLESALRSG